MITRCVETDLRKMVQKIIDDKHPHEKFAIQRFEENLTRRWAKKPIFLFTTVSIGGTDKAGKVGAVSLSGICALTVIADKEEMIGRNFSISSKEYEKMKLMFTPKKIQ